MNLNITKKKINYLFIFEFREGTSRSYEDVEPDGTTQELFTPDGPPPFTVQTPKQTSKQPENLAKSDIDSDFQNPEEKRFVFFFFHWKSKNMIIMIND